MGLKVRLQVTIKSAIPSAPACCLEYPPNLLYTGWATPLLCQKFVYVVQTLNLARFLAVQTARRFLCLSIAAITSLEKGRCAFS